MLIDDLLQDYKDNLTGDFVVSVAAEDFIQQCRAMYATELQKWLDGRAVEFVAADLRRLLHVQRNRTRRLAPIVAHRDAVDAYQDDPDGDGRDVLQAHYAVNHANLWRRLSDMTRDDLGFVADQYESRGNRNLLWGSFFRALERKVPIGRTVADVFTAEQVAEMQERLLGGVEDE